MPCTARVGTASCISGICVANGDGPGQTPTPSGGGGGGGGGAGSRRYQQCGGKYYDGPTNCGTGLTCQQANDYYSQVCALLCCLCGRWYVLSCNV